MQPASRPARLNGGDFKGWRPLARYALLARHRGGWTGRVWIANAVVLGPSALSLDDREIVEVEIAQHRLGPCWSQGWGAGWEAFAAEDGGDDAHAGAAALAGEGIHGKGALFILHLAQ